MRALHEQFRREVLVEEAEHKHGQGSERDVEHGQGERVVHWLGVRKSIDGGNVFVGSEKLP